MSNPDENMPDADEPTHDPTEEPEEPEEEPQLSDQASNGTPKPSPSATRRRGGRLLRGRQTDVSTPDPTPEDVSESGGGAGTGTPLKRRRGRPSGGGWRGGFRGRARRGPQGPSHATRVPIDKEGNTMEVISDEVALPENTEGETKVNKDGELQGGREYRVRVFTIKGRGRRLYMLSTEPARCTGFRDSYLFFTKHLHLFKIIIGDEEKRDLIDRDILPHSYKGRAIGVVTARSVFREFGARIVVRGRKVVDDYNADDARARGDAEGELADPHDRLPNEGQPYNRNQYVAWHGASSVYHSNMPVGPVVNGRPIGGGSKRKAAITSANWMLEHAREAARFNAALATERRKTLNGVYDPHTNLVCYPRHMQPTHAKWERVPEPYSSPTKPTRPEHDQINGAPSSSPSHTNGNIENKADTELQSIYRMPPPSSLVTRNFLVADSYYLTPPHATLPPPGPSPLVSKLQQPLDEYPLDGGLPELDSEDLGSLDEESRTAYLKRRQLEEEWRSCWGNEEIDGSRAKLRIGVGVL